MTHDVKIFLNIVVELKVKNGEGVAVNFSQKLTFSYSLSCFILES